MYGFHPSMKSSRKKIPPKSVRAGVEYDSSADNTTTDPVMKQTTRTVNSTVPETITPDPGIKLQICSCGWAKVTSSAGLIIGKGSGTGTSHQPLLVQQKEENRCLQDINIPVPVEEVDSNAAETMKPANHTFQ